MIQVYKKLAGFESSLTSFACGDSGRFKDIGKVKLQHFAHILSSLLVVLGDQGCVPSRLRHLHAEVESCSSWKSTEHKNDTPYVVGLWGRGTDVIRLVRVRGISCFERRGHHDRHNRSSQYSKTLVFRNQRTPIKERKNISSDLKPMSSRISWESMRCTKIFGDFG